MLLDLKQAIRDGSPVPIQLILEDKAGKRELVEVKAAGARSLGK